MTNKELRDKLAEFPDDLDVMYLDYEGGDTQIQDVDLAQPYVAESSGTCILPMRILLS